MTFLRNFLIEETMLLFDSRFRTSGFSLVNLKFEYATLCKGGSLSKFTDREGWGRMTKISFYRTMYLKTMQRVYSAYCVADDHFTKYCSMRAVLWLLLTSRK